MLNSPLKTRPFNTVHPISSNDNTSVQGCSATASFLTQDLSQAGDYYIIVSSSTQNSGYASLSLSSAPLPPVISLVDPPSGGYKWTLGEPGVPINVTGADSYTWSPAAGLNATTGPTVSASPSTTTTYTVVGTSCGNTSQPLQVQVQAVPGNYITTRVAQVAGKTTVQSMIGQPPQDVAVSTVYYDGLGRPSQKVAWAGTTTQHDLVQPITYDALGRPAVSYLPYPQDVNNGGYKLNAVSQQAAFYQPATSLSLTAQDASPFAITQYEASPSSRTLEQGAAGATWQPGTGHTVKTTQRSNTTADAVRQWNYDIAGQTYSTPGAYPAGTLQVKETRDEQNQLVTEYLNTQGQTLLKRVSIAPTVCNLAYESNGSLSLTAPSGQFISIRRAVFGHLISGSTCADAVFDPATSADVTAYVQGLVTLPQASVSVPINYQQLGPDPYPGSGKYLQVEAAYAPTTTSTDLLTYYVYDDLNNLRLVISPEGTRELITGNWGSLTDDFIKRWCFRYDYDGRHRVVSKQIPGTLPVRLVYNQRDQPVLAQDGNQAQAGAAEWTFTKYDGQGRPIMTGIVNLPGKSQADLQAILNSQTVLTESLDNSVNVGYTLTQSFPQNTTNTQGVSTALTESNLLTVIYYDRYTAPILANSQLACTLASGQWLPIPFGMQTGSSVRTLPPDGSLGNWLTTATYYDSNYHVVQSWAQNQLGGLNTQVMTYDLVGKVLTSTTQVAPGGYRAPWYRDSKRFTYYSNGLLRETYEKLASIETAANGQPEILLARNLYNELGQLSAKCLHSADGSGTKFLQKVDYRYNIRGWLTHINNRDLDNTSIEQAPGVYVQDNSDSGVADSDLFGLELRYDNMLHGGASPQYNGNVAQAMWQTRSLNPNKKQNNLLRAYNYSYDPANRIIGAQYTTYVPNAGWDPTNQPVDFSVSGIGYDGNGNLTQMTRRGTVNGSNDSPVKGTIDQLTYSYQRLVNNQLIRSNQLLGVDDGAGTNQAPHDFEDNGSQYSSSGTGTPEYGYDFNGNLMRDTNKGITGISYTRQNQPTVITLAPSAAAGSTGGTIKYTFSATGAKLTKQVYQGGVLQMTTDYLGPAVYQTAPNASVAPVFAQTDEGRVLYLPNDNSSTLPWKYEYQLKDQLGNMRYAFRADRDNGAVTQIKAGMEPANAVKEEQQFTHLAETRTADPDYARTGKYVARLNAQAGRRDGPTIRLSVKAGDSIRAEVYGRYDRGPIVGGLVQKGALTIGALSAGISGQRNIDRPQLTSTRRGWFPFAGLSLAIVPQLLFTKRPKLPVAYLRYELFNKDSQLVATKMQAIKRTALDEWQHLQVGTKVDSSGFARVSLINESGAPAYFDDMNVNSIAASPYQENHYDPFGLNLLGIEQAEVPNSQYQYNGKEKQEDLGLNWLDFGARMYDSQLGRWQMPDPLGIKYNWQSPYCSMDNNPILKVDPTGTEASPIYDNSGSFLGTDDEGVKGKAIVMNKTDFKQGMTHADASAKNLGVEGLKNKEAGAAIVNHYNTLATRPDYDGFVTINEGVTWAHDHPNALANPTPDNTLYLDAAKLDFGNLRESAFEKLNVTTFVNINTASNFFASLSNERLRGTVYALGRVNLQLLSRDGTVKVVNDPLNSTTDYDWSGGGSIMRRGLIKYERWRAEVDDTHGFKTFYYGNGKLNK